MKMSLKGQALRALVVERLVVAADEIFALFERTFAEYQDEVLRSKLLQQPGVGFYKEDIQTVTVGGDSSQVRTKIKQEEDSSLEIPLPSVKTEENINKPTHGKDPVKENRQDSVGAEPGCSMDLHLGGNEQHSDTDNSSDWEFMDKRSTKYDGQNLKPGHSKNSVVKNVISNDEHNRNSLKKHIQHAYNCSDCGIKFKHRYTLFRHVRRIHNKERPYRCLVCQKGFFRQYEYVNHMRIHTGERPFRCSVCGNSYRYKQSLKDHKCVQIEFQDRIGGVELE